MRYLVYAYILECKALQNVGMRFDPRYDITVDVDQKVICISRVVSTVCNLYGDNIYSTTVIVGNNGAGKTSTLRFLLEALVSGDGIKDANGIIITFDAQNNLLEVYMPKSSKYKVDANGVNYRYADECQSIETFFYSGYNNPLTMEADVLTMQWDGLTNACDGCLLTRDLQEYGNEISTDGRFTFREYASAHNYQNQWRICTFLSEYQGDVKSILHLPRIVHILPNTSGCWGLENRINEKKNNIKPKEYLIPKNWIPKEKRCAEIIYHCLYNLVADKVVKRDVVLGSIDSWLENSIKYYSGNIVNDFDGYVQVCEKEDHNDYSAALRKIHTVVEFLYNHARLDEYTYEPSFFFDFEQDGGLISRLLDLVNYNRIFLTCRYFDMNYAHKPSSWSALSSGEMALLNMYSRIYYTLKTKRSLYNNAPVPVLYVFDEAEIAFHPEWQRKYVRYISAFLNEMAAHANRQFQIILTSHSPIILSDIPIECTIMLKRSMEDGMTDNVASTKPQTFGTNIFELYRDSFFLEGGLVGELAQGYIKQIDDDITQLQHPDAGQLDELRKRIALIGDGNIRSYLLLQLGKYDHQAMIHYYQEQIERLRHEQN